MTNLYTIGTTKKSLKQFIKLLQQNKIETLIDTRLHNTSQLAGFSKKDDLSFILGLVKIKYSHNLSLAPSQEFLRPFKHKQLSWEQYENFYIDLIKNRHVEKQINNIVGTGHNCILCSEDSPSHCHRRLLAQYLKEFDASIQIVHLK